MSQFGNEKRTSILPVMSPTASAAANYDPSNELPNPAQLGVHREGSLNMVGRSFGALGYYVDMIGFGERSSDLSLEGSFPMGNNYFMNTSAICDNGAAMWYYVKGIPTGNALGENVKRALRDMKLPQLRGLAPGIIEDAKDALDARPVLGAMFGKGYPRCKKMEAQVGDMKGKRQNADGEYWIEDPDSSYQKSDGLWYQEKWVQDTNSKDQPIFIDQKEYKCTPKRLDLDGTELDESEIPPLDDSCNAPEGFLTLKEQQKIGLLTVGVLVASAVLFIFSRKH